jgi:predicted amidophosphoribosyltransferase
MAEEQKLSQEQVRAFFAGTPCAEMMRKMMEGKKVGQDFDCQEMMAKMMPLWRRFMDTAAEDEGKKKEVPVPGR